jgi:hypothetical protein
MSKNGTAIDTIKLLIRRLKYLQMTIYIRLGCQNPRDLGAELA